MSNGSNSAADRAAAMQLAEDMGKREGGGSAARAGFYYQLTEFAKDKRLDVNDAQEAWETFYRGAASGASMVGGVKDLNDDIKKVRVSECRQFLKLGGLPYVDGLDTLSRGMRIIKAEKASGNLKSKATDAMLNVARAQNNDSQNPLDDATIEVIIHPKVGETKVEADALEQVRKRLEQIIKKFGASDETETAYSEIEQRITDLGGTTMAKRAAKAAAKKGK